MTNPAFGDAKRLDPDLPLSPDGMTYHVPARSDQLADRIILVGDPGRVSTVAAFFDEGSVRYEGSHREINVATGTFKGVPVTVLSTGMGTDNTEIVVNEVHVLKEFALDKNAWRRRVGDEGGAACNKAGEEPAFDPATIKLIRVGTCGSPNEDVPLGHLAITRHSVGLDNTCQYYQPPAVNSSADVQEVLTKTQAALEGKVQVYATKAHPAVTSALVAACEKYNTTHADGEKQGFYVGTTCSASGFYGCQGRSVGHFRGRITVPELTERLGELQFTLPDGSVERVANLEMENSSLTYLSNVLGYQAGTVCAVIARRARSDRAFATPDQAKRSLNNAIQIALDAITTMK